MLNPVQLQEFTLRICPVISVSYDSDPDSDGTYWCTVLYRSRVIWRTRPRNRRAVLYRDIDHVTADNGSARNTSTYGRSLR